MLPIFKKKDGSANSPGLIIKTRSSDNSSESEELKHPADEIVEPMRDFMQSIKSNDPEGMADAIYCAHEILHGRMTPEEYKGEAVEAPEPHSYEASKEE